MKPAQAYDEGYKEGFREGLEFASRLMETTEPEKKAELIAEYMAKQKGGKK